MYIKHHFYEQNVKVFCDDFWPIKPDFFTHHKRQGTESFIRGGGGGLLFYENGLS